MINFVSLSSKGGVWVVGVCGQAINQGWEEGGQTEGQLVEGHYYCALVRGICTGNRSSALIGYAIPQAVKIHESCRWMRRYPSNLSFRDSSPWKEKKNSNAKLRAEIDGKSRPNRLTTGEEHGIALSGSVRLLFFVVVVYRHTTLANLSSHCWCRRKIDLHQEPC